MRIVIDRNRCIGAGMCTGIAPDIFELHDGTLVVLQEQPDMNRRTSVESAVLCCPVEAISIDNEPGSDT